MQGPYCYSFDRVADEYEATRFLPSEIADALARLVTASLSPATWLLDAGVGTGRIGRALARHHERTIGVDIARAMLARMVDAAPPYRVQADLRALPFADNTFHGVLSVHVFHLIYHWQQALAEMWRVLAPGGTLFIGFEERSRTVVREHYLHAAATRHVLPTRVGASSHQLAQTLEAWGATVERQQPEQLYWEHDISIATTLSMLSRRTYSLLWEIPEPIHQEMLKATTAWALTEFGDLDATETTQNQLVLYRVFKPTT
jgi:ubiquinone/menaquinone biosynthesis C-methylase UbiE